MRLLAKIFPLIFLFSFLGGCVTIRQTPPDYMVMLTGLYPDSQDRCTGALYDPWTVMTVGH